MKTTTPPVYFRLAQLRVTEEDADKLLTLLEEISSHLTVVDELVEDHPELTMAFRSGAWCEIAARFQDLIGETK